MGFRVLSSDGFVKTSTSVTPADLPYTLLVQDEDQTIPANCGICVPGPYNMGSFTLTLGTDAVFMVL